MKKIIVASKNPVKIQAALEGFERMFPGELWDVEGVSVPSGVNDQPMTSQETLQGALNRAQAVRELYPAADYWIGIEGGVQPEPVGSLTQGELWALAWVAVVGPCNDQKDFTIGKGCTGAFPLPTRLSELVHQGIELGKADDIVFERSNSKQENGAVGLLTEDVINRRSYYVQAVILALIPFKNPTLYAE